MRLVLTLLLFLSTVVLPAQETLPVPEKKQPATSPRQLVSDLGSDDFKTRSVDPTPVRAVFCLPFQPKRPLGERFVPTHCSPR